jgi:hypothetical protein
MIPTCLERIAPNEYRCTRGILRSTIRTESKRIICSACERGSEEHRAAMASEARAKIMAQVYRRHMVDPAYRTLLEIEAILDERAANGLSGYDGCGCSGLDEFVTRLLYRDKEVRRK